MSKRRGLGKGLDALLGVGAGPLAEAGPAGDEGLKTLPLDALERGPYQPRRDFKPEALRELADSIRAQGLVQPIVARRRPGLEKYEIIAGERRWRAARLAGLREVPVVIRDAPDKTVMCIGLIENIQREDLNPLEEAGALDRLIREFEMRHEDIAAAIGRSRSAVSNLLRLLELEQEVKRMLAAGELEMGHARALLSLPASQQAAVARKVAQQGLSVRGTEALVKTLGPDNKPGPAGPAAKMEPNTLKLQNDLSERLGARVIIRQQRGQKGTLQIHYNSLAELDGILAHIK